MSVARATCSGDGLATIAEAGNDSCVPASAVSVFSEAGMTAATPSASAAAASSETNAFRSRRGSGTSTMPWAVRERLEYVPGSSTATHGTYPAR